MRRGSYWKWFWSALGLKVKIHGLGQGSGRLRYQQCPCRSSSIGPKLNDDIHVRYLMMHWADIFLRNYKTIGYTLPVSIAFCCWTLRGNCVAMKFLSVSCLNNASFYKSLIPWETNDLLQTCTQASKQVICRSINIKYILRLWS